MRQIKPTENLEPGISVTVNAPAASPVSFVARQKGAEVQGAPSPGTVASGAVGASDATQSNRLNPELLAELQGKATAAIFGEATGLFMRSPEHSGMTLAELDRLLIPAIRHQQILFAHMKDKQTGQTGPAGIILWAEVSRNVEKRLEKQEANGRFELEPAD